MNLFQSLHNINSIEEATGRLESILFYSITPKVRDAINCCIAAHEGQFRKSGIPYAVHPILVSCIVAYYGGGESMICASLLHDVVEDTSYDIKWVKNEFGDDVASLVDSLTKIVDIRKEEYTSIENGNDKLIASALSFRKILIASIQDVRALVIKVSDRLHNMLTLDALTHKQQIRISEETLLVYSPIAHRLGISSIKNELEDKSFFYIFKNEYSEISNYLNQNRQNLILKLNNFSQKVKHLLMQEGIDESEFRIESRIKRPYSIFLKMQSKGIGIDEILDLLAIRIITSNDIDCYRILGIIHLRLKPIMSRFKDYISLPKENGYQTIHTTVFYETYIFEIQIRSIRMHNSAEFGVAAHWKYKNTGVSPSLNWLNNLQYQNSNIEEFYELAKNELYKEDIIVFSPDGDTYNLPVGAIALDFAYAIHTDLGNHAKEAYINNQKASLLTVLKSGDIVKIIQGDTPKPKCTWIDALKTSKAKSNVKNFCTLKIKEIDQKSSINILSTIFFNHDVKIIERFISSNSLQQSIYKVSKDIDFLLDVKTRIKNNLKKNANLISKIRLDRLKLKRYEFDNLVIHSNHAISGVVLNYCCNPKYKDGIVGIKHSSKVYIHHQLCDRALSEINGKNSMVFVTWKEKTTTNVYKIVLAFANKKRILSDILNTIMKYNCNITSISYDAKAKSLLPSTPMPLSTMTNCEITFETSSEDLEILKTKLMKKCKIMDLMKLKG